MLDPKAELNFTQLEVKNPLCGNLFHRYTLIRIVKKLT